MADKTYKMTVALSNGTTLNAGTFVAPQGPIGPQGPSGVLGDWQTLTPTTELEDGIYIFATDNNQNNECGAGVGKIKGGSGYIMTEQRTVPFDADASMIFVQIEFAQKKFKRFKETVFEMTLETGQVIAGTQDFDDMTVYSAKYIFMKTL